MGKTIGTETRRILEYEMKMGREKVEKTTTLQKKKLERFKEDIEINEGKLQVATSCLNMG